MTIERFDPIDFLLRAKTAPVVDVRSPKEFTQGHIPGAFNIPLFSDEERAQVGITYTKTGNQSALMKGLELVGPKLKELVTQAGKISPGGELLVHCWRGGMRSEAMTWLFNFSGLKAGMLEGGYKAYKRYIRQSLESGPEIKVLGGMTGSGKTEMIQFLAAAGEQVIDLEALAHHKGSAFGGLGESPQPTTEQFENDLSQIWLALDTNRHVWVEDESLNIGKVIIPEPFFNRMRNAPLYFLEVPFENRVERLMEQYGCYEKSILMGLIEKISRRMGGDQAKMASDSLMNGDLRKAVSLVLKYYDKTYRHSLENREKMNIRIVSGENLMDPQAMADRGLALPGFPGGLK